MKLETRKIRRDFSKGDIKGQRYAVVALPAAVAALWMETELVSTYYDEQTDTLTIRPLKEMV